MWDEAIPDNQWGSPGVGPTGLRRERRGVGKVNEKGLLQVSFSYYHQKRDPGRGWYAKDRTGVAAVLMLYCSK